MRKGHMKGHMIAHTVAYERRLRTVIL